VLRRRSRCLGMSTSLSVGVHPKREEGLEQHGSARREDSCPGQHSEVHLQLISMALASEGLG
jgi:hypothetical protein